MLALMSAMHNTNSHDVYFAKAVHFLFKQYLIKVRSFLSISDVEIPFCENMADPISLAASIIAIVGACTASTRFILRFTDTIHKAPQELIFISNEVADLAVVLLQAQKTYCANLEGSSSKENLPDDSSQGLLASQLRQAQTCLSELDALTRACSKVDTKGAIRIDRTGWYRRRKTVDKLQQRLRFSRKNIHMLITIETA